MEFSGVCAFPGMKEIAIARGKDSPQGRRQPPADEILTDVLIAFVTGVFTLPLQ
jgi:hypothetical protein